VFARCEAMGLPTNLVSVGRLDANSEGLLLLTTSGALARHLELPGSGYARVYRVKVYGRHVDRALAALRRGATVDGVRYRADRVEVMRTVRGDGVKAGEGAAATDDEERSDEPQRGDAETRGAVDDKPTLAWVEITLSEGKVRAGIGAGAARVVTSHGTDSPACPQNREIRRVLEHFGCIVNRLVRMGYGPFALGRLRPGFAKELDVPPGMRRKSLHAGAGSRAAADAAGEGTGALPAARSGGRRRSSAVV